MSKKHNHAYLKEDRKQLRSQLTSAEATLWKSIKGKQLDGRKFRRQHSIDDFIVDFYCPSERLIVELDGGIHDNVGQAAADQHRDQILHSMGFIIMRFPNEEVIKALPNVLSQIRALWLEGNSP